MRLALEGMRAEVDELDAGADDQFLDGRCHEHGTGVGAAGDPRADVHRAAAEFVAEHLALAGMHAHPQLRAQRLHRRAQRGAAARGARRAVEGREQAVAGGVELAPAEQFQLLVGERAPGTRRRHTAST